MTTQHYRRCWDFHFPKCECLQTHSSFRRQQQQVHCHSYTPSGVLCKTEKAAVNRINIISPTHCCTLPLCSNEDPLSPLVDATLVKDLMETEERKRTSTRYRSLQSQCLPETCCSFSYAKRGKKLWVLCSKTLPLLQHCWLLLCHRVCNFCSLVCNAEEGKLAEVISFHFWNRSLNKRLITSDTGFLCLMNGWPLELE